MSKDVTIDIGKTPVNGLQKGEGGKYYYEDDGFTGERVNVTLTENPPETHGYKKLEHKPEDDNTKIVRIENLGGTQPGFSEDLSRYSSVTVYFWVFDETFNNHLIIKLTGTQDKYYIELINLP